MDILDLLRTPPNCTCHAYSAFECCCDTTWPENYVKEAADEIERLRKEVAVLRVHDSFYQLTVQQRDAAWRECEELRAQLERIQHPPSTAHNTYSDLVSDGGMDPRYRTQSND